jgi:hypothetical protein
MAGPVSVFTPEVLESARNLIGAGVSKTDAAAQLGVSRTGLTSALRRESDPHPHREPHVDVDREFVEIPVFERDYSHLDALYAYPLGDVHIGAASHQSDRWSEWLGFLADNEDTSMVGLGDFLNAAVIGSKSDTYAEKLTVQEAKWRLAEQLTPLADQHRIDVLMPGNHENRVTRLTGEDPIYDVARVLNANYAAAAAMIHYRVGDQSYEVYVRHGTGNGQSLAQLDKSAMVAKADVYITGHVHKIATTCDEYFVREEGRMTRRRRYYVTSGAFLAYEQYAAERGYKPSRIGAPRIYLSGDKHDVHISI